MKFLCPNCKAKYQIADEKVSGRTLRMDCRRCGHNITIRADMAIDDAEDAPAPAKPAAKPAAASSATASARGRAALQGAGAGLTGAHTAQPAGGSLGADFHRSVSKPHDPPRATPLDQWHVAINDVPVGPLRREEITKKIAAGAVTADSLCWREGLDDWRPIRDVPELAALLRRSLAPEAPARGAPARAPLGAGPPRAAPPAARPPAASPAARAAARSNVVPIGGRLGGAAAPALDDDHELDTDEPTRVGNVDLADLEAKALAAEAKAAEAKRAATEAKAAEAKAAEAKAAEAKAKPADKPLFPDVKRPPTGKTSTREQLPPPPKPAGRPDTGRTAVPLVQPKAKPAPEIVDEHDDLPIGEPSFAEVPAAAAPAFVSAPQPAAAAPAPLPIAPAPTPVSTPRTSTPPREEEKRRGGGIPIPALIAIAGATAFGGVMAYMIGTRYLGPPTPTTAPAVATVTTTPPPTTTAPPPTDLLEVPPETTTPPTTTEAPPETTTTAPPTTTTTGTGHVTRPAHSGTGGATTPPSTTTSTAASGGAQSATKAPTGRFAEFADDGEGPAHIATSGRTSLADEPSGASSGSTRGQQELTADQIRAVITRERPAVNRCWESELRRLGTAATVRLDVDLTIGGSGTVTSVTTRGQSVGTLADCIERNVRRWRFPPVSGSTQTSFPLVFSGTE